MTLGRVEKQRLDWEARGEPPKKKESDLAALTLAFKKALKLDTKKVNVEKCPPEVPAHVSWFS